ncbi:uncharacterized protein [Chelonus insularis]|uniref:uncharacterized protein isoform X2 n=1 Tax=Chelonus insularis TaxID=460826 RepID=UPI001589A002|nr:uncharacterized protein LOC118071907 isoform X2 [Chelonus insularis]
MKELEQVHDAPTTRTLKSLLKKPGQGKQRNKNRVVINEKLNEFFAADYIILIKEECCADYEEECDCCCQEPEMIRLGNCKECRAEFNRHLASGEIDPRFNHERNGKIESDLSRRMGSEESQCEDDDEDDEEEEYEEEVDDDDEENDEAESSEETEHRDPILQTPTSQPQQQETLSPPEGYKDVCDDDMKSEVVSSELCLGPVVVCGECNYYNNRQRTSGDEYNPEKVQEDEKNKNVHEEIQGNDQQQINEKSQQPTTDLHQRYLVETITMTTVTERRIVREISEDKSNTSNVSSVENTDTRITEVNPSASEALNGPENHVGTELIDEDDKKHQNKTTGSEGDKDTTDSSELSLTFKLGNVSLVTNSFKPNSAVRQLFPNPKFISPPPTLSKGISSVLSNDEGTDSDGSEAQRYLVTTENLRLFDSVKRSKLAGSRSDSSESDSSTIKRTIERNALRRSLVCKYETGKKKNSINKDLTLEERIRQLTCVDPEEDTTGDSASDSVVNNESSNQDQLQDLPIRTSPSGEERPLRNERVVRPNNECQEHSPSPPPSLHHHHHHHHYHHHHHQSAYKKITELFSAKKGDNMPDLGIGDKTCMKSPNPKVNTDARKQFLASLAPLSCVTSTGVDSQHEYYQLTSKINNRDSVGYNSDSSYSLEDIEAALRSDERNNKNAGPPDVTRGTPTGTGPDLTDSTTDELLAFVEQDKSRTERLKRRYDMDDHKESTNNLDKNGISQGDDEDDELNDYGFNRRPSVRGIKPQFETTSEIVRQLRYRTIPTSITDKTRVLPPGWPYYDTDSLEKQRVSFSQDQEEINGTVRDSTINRINTMQRQIDDIYQTIAETAVSVQGSIERGSYLESTLPRNAPRLSTPECHRYEQKNGTHFQDHRMRMEVPATSVYNSLAKTRRATVAISNYPCGVMPLENATKCYRTMYLVPYNGITDPTYQNIQRILPPHSSTTNYANHIERYPYPRNTRVDHQQVPRYYPRTPPGTSITPIPPPPPLHLHLHQPEDVGFTAGVGMQTIQLQHHQHISHQLATYNVQSVPTYTVMAPSRTGGYHSYPHPGRNAVDIHTHTVSLPLAMTNTTTVSSGGFNGSNNHLTSTSSSSSTSSALSSPTKIQQMNTLCTAGERGVPEGAASAPAHDFVSQANNTSAHNLTSFIGHNVPPPNTQNSVYYAMNV